MKYSITELLEKYQVIIPQLQRDYAQGRDSNEELRKKFVNKIKKALQDNSEILNLDFIYGYTEKSSNNQIAFIPLDGQQRLTTLWLILWYLAPRENNVIANNIQTYLKNFTYETRISSKRFCLNLVTKALAINKTELISEQIIDAPWFMASWMNDPTIISMMNMLDTLQQEMVEDLSIAWQNLVYENKITFDYINIKAEEFKLTDELYIKMNSRGKPLTSFENFKAQFSALLSSDETDYLGLTLDFEDTKITYQQYFAFKIDSKWMDLFWSYRDKINIFNSNKEKKDKISIDDSINNYIYFIAEILYYQKKENSINFNRDIENLNLVFKNKENLLFLFDSLDFLSNLENVDKFFESLFCNNIFIEGKIKLFDDKTTNLFFRAITNSNFEVRHNVLLFTILSFSIKKQLNSPDNHLKELVRIIRNLLLRVRQPNASARTEYMPNLRLNLFSEYSEFVNNLIDDIINNSKDNVFEIFARGQYKGFSKEIIKSEQDKSRYISENEKNKNAILKLEEHNYLQGVTDNFNLKSKDFVDKSDAFMEIWKPNVDSTLLIRALLVYGDFSICTHEYTRLGEAWYFGKNGNWNRILTAYNTDEQEKIKPVLDNFLESYIKTESESVEDKLNEIIQQYDSSNLKDWVYYFINYPDMTSSERLNLFSWKEEGFKIYSLGNSGKKPLSSYHFSPYISVLKTVLNDNKNSKWEWGRHSESFSYLELCERFKIYSSKNGWLITTEKRKPLPNSIIEKYNINVIDERNWELLCKKNQDKIKIAKNICEDIILEF